MHVTQLTLRHFRNIGALDWRPAPGLNLIWGRNGQGKTNLLEGLHLALTGRSFRTHRDEELIPWTRTGTGPAARAEEDLADPTLAQAVVARQSGEQRLRVLLGRDWKRAFAGERWLPRLADLWGEAAVVTFSPDEAGLLKGPPAGRRRFLDIVLSQLSRVYLEQLQRYSQALRQLNAVYKSQPPGRDVRELAAAWYPALAESGATLMLLRARRLREAAAPMTERFATLGGDRTIQEDEAGVEQGALELRYDPDVRIKDLDPADPALDPRTLTEAYHARLAANYDEGRRQGLCTLGVHRDDFEMRLGGADLRRFGSQGQHRLAALTLKLESARWIEQAVGEAPILLLDDFGSELDPGRRQSVLAGLKGRLQVIITATHPADLGPGDLFDEVRQMAGGRLVD